MTLTYVIEKFELHEKEEGNGYQMQNAPTRCLSISVNCKQTSKIVRKRALFLENHILYEGFTFSCHFFIDLRPIEVKHI